MKGEYLKGILNKIKKDKNLSYAEIAATAKVDRSYLSLLVNKNKHKDVEENFLLRLNEAFPEYVVLKTANATPFTPPDDEILADRAMLKVIVSEVAKLQATVYGRNLKDCFQELENSTILLVEQMKRNLKK